MCFQHSNAKARQLSVNIHNLCKIVKIPPILSHKHVIIFTVALYVSSSVTQRWCSLRAEVSAASVERGGQESHRSSLTKETASPSVRESHQENSIGELGYVQLYAIPTAALVGICCLVVTRRNLCFSSSPVTCRFEAVANEA